MAGLLGSQEPQREFTELLAVDTEVDKQMTPFSEALSQSQQPQSLTAEIRGKKKKNLLLAVIGGVGLV